MLLRESAAGAAGANDAGGDDDVAALRKENADLRERLGLMYEIAEALRGNSKPAKEAARPTRDGLTFDDDDEPRGSTLREAGRERRVNDNGARISFDDEPPQKTWLREAI